MYKMSSGQTYAQTHRFIDHKTDTLLRTKRTKLIKTPSGQGTQTRKYQGDIQTLSELSVTHNLVYYKDYKGKVSRDGRSCTMDPGRLASGTVT